jgi:hypothetical protein
MLKRPAPEQTALEIVTLDQPVPADHLLRKIDRSIDFSFIHDLTAPLYCADNGRPPLNPTLMFKALFIGYLFDYWADLDRAIDAGRALNQIIEWRGRAPSPFAWTTARNMSARR